MKYSFLKSMALAVCLALLCSLWGCKAQESGTVSGEAATNGTSSSTAPESDVDVKDLDYSAAAILIKQGGSYTIDKEINGTVVVNTKEDLTLKLNGATVKSEVGPAIYVVNCGSFTLELSGSNTISDCESYSGSFVYAKGALASEDDVTINGSGSLTVTGCYKHGIVCDDALYLNGGKITVVSAVSDGVHANDLIEFNGAELTVENAESDAVECETKITVNSGSLILNSAGDGLKAAKDDTADTVCDVTVNGGSIKITTEEDGIQSDGALTFNNGTLDITTTGEVSQSNIDDWQNGMGGMGGMGGGRPGMGGPAMPDKEMQSNTQSTSDTASDSSKGIKATGVITVNGGNITVNSTDDSVHSDNSVVIQNGTLALSTQDDGIHAENDLTVNGGKIDITKSYEGLEGKTVTVNGGSISIIASDDGMNATSGNASNNMPGNANGENIIKITGGTVYVKVGGDGIDSNGSLLVEGGTLVVDASTSNGNSPLDADGQRIITGGVVIAAGTDSMLENPQATSSQCSMVVMGLRLMQGTTVALKDENGNTLLCYTLTGSASSLTISVPQLSIGGKYSLYTGVSPTGTELCGGLYYGDGTDCEGGTLLKEITLSSKVTQTR